MEVAQDRDAVCLRLRPGTVATFCMRAVLALLDIEVINQAEVLPFFLWLMDFLADCHMPCRTDVHVSVFVERESVLSFIARTIGNDGIQFGNEVEFLLRVFFGFCECKIVPPGVGGIANDVFDFEQEAARRRSFRRS